MTTPSRARGCGFRPSKRKMGRAALMDRIPRRGFLEKSRAGSSKMATRLEIWTLSGEKVNEDTVPNSGPNSD